jgi:tetratricopeptide (TPR) repeat protein/O-antigen ligase
VSKKNRNQPEELKSNLGVEATPPVARKVVAVTPRPAASSSEMDWKDHVLPLFLGIVCAYLPYKVEPNIRDLFQLPKQMIMAEAAVWLILLAGALALAGRPLKLPKTPMLWPGAVLMVAIAGGVWIAPSQTGGVLSIFARMDAHRWVSAAIVFMIALLGLTSPKKLWYIIAGNLLGGLLVSLIGIGEWHNIRGLLPEPHWRSITNPGSTFGNRNMAAQEIVAVMPAAYVVMSLAVRWILTRKLWEGIVLGVVGALSLITMLYYLVLAITRSTWLGAGAGALVAVAVLALGVLWPSKRDEPADSDAAEKPSGLEAVFGAPAQKVLMTAGAAVAALLVIVLVADHFKPADKNVQADDKAKMSVPELLRSFMDSKANHYRWRIGMAESTVEAIKDKPLGGGAGNWRVIYPQYVTQREKNEMFNIAKQPIRAHNDFLQFGSEFGVHGLLALLTLLGMAGWLTLRTVRKAATPDGRDQEDSAWLAFCALASLASLVAICGDAMASFPLQLPGPTFLFALHLATIASAEAMLYKRGFFGSRSEGEGKPPVVVTPMWLGGTLLAVGLIGLKFLGPIYLMPGDVNLDSYRSLSVEQAKDKGLHQRWLVAELGFTDGRQLQKMGRAQAGLLAIQRAIALNPDDFQNHFIEGLNLNSLGKTQEAIKSIENSLKLYPNLLNAWVNLAMFNRRLGDDKKMNEAIDIAIKLKPDELIALNVRAAWLEEKGQYEEELKLLTPQIKPYEEYRKSPNWPTDDGGQLLGSWKTTLTHCLTAARKLEKWQDAIVFKTLLNNEEVPNELPNREPRPEDDIVKDKMDREAELAEYFGKAGKWQDALAHFKAAAELARAGYPEQKQNYAHALLHAGDYPEAQHQMQVAIQVGMTRDKAGEMLDQWAKDMPEKSAEVLKIREKVAGKPKAPEPAADTP